MDRDTISVKDVISRNKERIIGHGSNKERLSNNETTYLKNESRESSLEATNHEKKVVIYKKRASLASINCGSPKRL